MEITYRKLSQAELNTFIDMRIAQLTEEYEVEGKRPPEDVDLKAALEEYYQKHMADGTFVSWLALDGDKIVGEYIFISGFKCCYNGSRRDIYDKGHIVDHNERILYSLVRRHISAAFQSSELLSRHLKSAIAHS